MKTINSKGGIRYDLVNSVYCWSYYFECLFPEVRVREKRYSRA